MKLGKVVQGGCVCLVDSKQMHKKVVVSDLHACYKLIQQYIIFMPIVQRIQACGLSEVTCKEFVNINC